MILKSVVKVQVFDVKGTPVLCERVAGTATTEALFEVIEALLQIKPRPSTERRDQLMTARDLVKNWDPKSNSTAVIVAGVTIGNITFTEEYPTWV